MRRRSGRWNAHRACTNRPFRSVGRPRGALSRMVASTRINSSQQGDNPMTRKHHDPELEGVAIATAGMVMAIAAHDRQRNYTEEACPLPLAEMDLFAIDPARLDFMSLTQDPVRHSLMAGLRRLGHEALRIGGPGAVAEIRGRILADAYREECDVDQWRMALDTAWVAVDGS